MSEEQPVRFYAVSYGSYDDYCEWYVLATSPENALRQFLRSDSPYYNVVGTVWKADLNDNGIIHKTDLEFEMEIPGKNGYLWGRSGYAEVDDIDAKYGLTRCLLCGCTPDGNPPLSEAEKAVFLNADNKCIDCAKFKMFKP